MKNALLIKINEEEIFLIGMGKAKFDSFGISFPEGISYFDKNKMNESFINDLKDILRKYQGIEFNSIDLPIIDIEDVAVMEISQEHFDFFLPYIEIIELSPVMQGLDSFLSSLLGKG